MKEFLTVDKALIKGHQVLTIPVFLIILLSLIIIFSLVITDRISNYFIPLSFPISIGLALLYWSKITVKWRIWAFENTRNVHELKKRAIEEDLMQKENHISHKFEMWSKSEIEKWTVISRKFDIDDVFIDDPNIPSETIIVNSKQKLTLKLTFFIFCLAFGLFTIFNTEQEIFGGILSLIGLYYIFISIKRYLNKELQFMISNFGIKIYNSDLIEWSEIKNEKVGNISNNSINKNYLYFNHSDGNEEIDIRELNISKRKLNKLLILYRQRYNAKNK